MIPAPKGEVFLCTECKRTFDDRSKACCPLHTILVEKTVTRDSLGRVVDCTASSGKQPFRVAKELL